MAPTQATSGDDALAEMGRLVSTAISLATQFEGAVAKLGADSNVATSSSAAPTALDPTVNPLALARDSATLIRAHATKISLFIINKPFTATAITKVLRDLVSGPLPGLASAAQLCDPKRYTKAVSHDLAWKCGRVFRELNELVKRIPTDGRVLSDAKKNSSFGAGEEKGSVATTGVLWSACDDVVTLANLGVAGYLVRKVEEFRDTLKDMMEELKEWSEEESEEEDDFDDEAYVSGEEDEAGPVAPHNHGGPSAAQTQTTQEMLDDIMNASSHIPRDDPERIRPRLESCLKRLRLTTLLYQAALKRRVKTVPPSCSEETTSRLDRVVFLMKRLQERFTSLALAFYDLDGQQIDSLMQECFNDAFGVSELLLKPWTPEKDKDEFTDWALKYQIEIKKA